MAKSKHPLWDALASLKLTIVCLAILMGLVACCTLAQVHLGTDQAVKLYMKSLWVFSRLPGTAWKLPVFPGGALVGLILLVNLVAAHAQRFELSRRKAGIWLVHAGLIVLFAGQFVTGLLQVETRMAIEEGSSLNYAESPSETEITLTDASGADADEVYSVPEGLFSRKQRVEDPRLPFTLVIKRYYANSELGMAAAGASSLADQGVGTRVRVVEAPLAAADDQANQPSAYVELLADGRSYGTWLLSSALGAPQTVSRGGRSYRLAMRQRRYYLPYTLTLKKFSHDIYPGTDIPKNFSSLVHLSDPGHEDRDVLIYMNNPLRYAGKAFYQASFGKNDTLSVLQVVENPGWRLPYIACALVALGLLLHFGLRLRSAQVLP